MAGVSDGEVAACKDVWGVFDLTNKGVLDAFLVGDMLRAMKFKPTNKQLEKVSGVKKAGEKELKFEEFLPIYKEISKEKDTGSYADFMEAFNVYDKEGNGLMLGAELRHLICSLGEKLSTPQADAIMKACSNEDSEGMVKYEGFVNKVLGGPFPEEDDPEGHAAALAAAAPKK